MTYGTPGETLNEVGLELLVHRIESLMNDYDLDGVDLVLVNNKFWLLDSCFIESITTYI